MRGKIRQIQEVIRMIDILLLKALFLLPLAG
jgi:hypothetical protein